MVLPFHYGALHAHEQVFTILLAVGPFVVLGIVIAYRRRAEAREDQRER